METHEIENQTAMSILWIGFNILIGGLIYLILRYILGGLFLWTLPFERIANFLETVATFIAGVLGVCSFVWLMFRSYYDFSNRNKGLRVNQFIDQELYLIYKQGKGYANPMTKNVENIPWFTEVVGVEEVPCTGIINGVTDEHRVYFTHSWRPQGKTYPFLGENDTKRRESARKKARALCVKTIRRMVSNSQTPTSQEIQEGEVFVDMIIENILPSKAVTEAMNDRAQATGKAAGIKEMIDETDLSPQDAAATLAGTLQRKTGRIEHVMVGDPDMIKNTKMEIIEE